LINKDQPSITIGAVSRATGIPVNTLRTWERRYGFPDAQRSPGGQRLYRPEIIAHLRAVNTALNKGLRPRQVMPLSMVELKMLLGEEEEQECSSRASKEIAPWINATKNLDMGFLDAELRRCASRLGVLELIKQRIIPFIGEIGEQWRRGEINIFHEHFASQRILDFLASTWRQLNHDATGRTIVCAALPAEKHFIGLHMASAVAALSNCRIVFLGENTPLEEIAGCVKQSKAKSVLMSVSITTPSQQAVPCLTRLRSILDEETEIIVGGLGAPQHLLGVLAIQSLDRLAKKLDGHT
jgi:MerR family transcriptional regulator, light-induced transcriptional regulator